MGIRIVVAQELHLSQEQEQRLRSLGDLKIYHDIAASPEEWKERCIGADIICSGKFGLKDRIYEMKGTFISLPFVAVHWIDKAMLQENNITVANCPGCNKVAVSEWIIGMMINLLRRLPSCINVDNPARLPGMTTSLAEKKVCILGKGNIGSRVGRICESLDMEVSYFLRGDDLLLRVHDAEIIIDCLGGNPSTKNILNKKFFSSLKNGSYFITVTGNAIWDADALCAALDNGILAGVATDAGSIQPWNVGDPLYQRLRSHPRVLATPHLSFDTDNTARVANDMMIDNIEAFLNGKPIHLVE